MSLEIVKRIKESDSLELALEYALNKLQKAVKKRNDDLHLINVVTVDEQNRPNTRNVVLRDFSIENLTIRFHTDKRSSKIKDIKLNKDICLIGYDKRAKLQIRIDAEAYSIDDKEILLEIWQKMYPMSRECYRVAKSPGDKIESLAEIKFNDENDSNLVGFDNFAAVQCNIKSMEILYLSHTSHIRAKYNNDNGILKGEWLVP
jgi:3-hydroxyisobutyrate dehydrogenase